MYLCIPNYTGDSYNHSDVSMSDRYIAECLISFEAWAKLTQTRLVCVPLGIHFEPINKELMVFCTVLK